VFCKPAGGRYHPIRSTTPSARKQPCHPPQAHVSPGRLTTRFGLVVDFRNRRRTGALRTRHPRTFPRPTSAGGEVIQEVTEMKLNPGIPIPEIAISGGGTVDIHLTLGERSIVMAEFTKARETARAAEPDPEPEPQTDTAYAEALRLYGGGDVDGALPYFKEAIAANPEDPEMLVTYANVLYKAQRFDEFEPAARAVIEVDPDNGEMMMMLYSSARGRGDLKTALEALLAVKEADLAGADLTQHLDLVAKKMGQSGRDPGLPGDPRHGRRQLGRL
jgi:hypothetical protein